MFCPNCGTQIDDNSLFCGACGAKIVASVKPVHTTQQIQANYIPVQKKKSSLPMVLTLVFVGLLVAAAIIVAVIFINKGRSIGDADDEISEETLEEVESYKKKIKKNKASYSTDGSQGLAVDFISDGGKDGYIVTGIGSCADVDVVVPQGAKNSDGDIMPYLWDDNGGFKEMSNVKNVTLPEGALEIRAGFADSPNLQWVLIPSSVQSICADVFKNCPSFKKIIYMGTVSQWDTINKAPQWNSGFDSAYAFDIVCLDGTVKSNKQVGDTAGDATAENNLDESNAALSANIATNLSTSAYADEEDVKWFYNFADKKYNDGMVREFDGSECELVNGGWKVYITPDENSTDHSTDTSFFLNAEIESTRDATFNVTYNWKYVLSGDKLIEDENTETAEGSWLPDFKNAAVCLDYARTEFGEFYISKNNDFEYICGEMDWNSGEKTYVLFYRYLD